MVEIHQNRFFHKLYVPYLLPPTSYLLPPTSYLATKRIPVRFHA